MYSYICKYLLQIAARQIKHQPMGSAFALASLPVRFSKPFALWAFDRYLVTIPKAQSLKPKPQTLNPKPFRSLGIRQVPCLNPKP